LNRAGRSLDGAGKAIIMTGAASRIRIKETTVLEIS
jgi:hypothetical protein